MHPSQSLLHVLIIQLFGLVVNLFLPLLANQNLWLLCHTLELALDVELNQTALDHCNQIAVILWDYESNWAMTPTVC